MEGWAESTPKHPTHGRHCDADRDAHLRPCATSSCTYILLSEDPNSLLRGFCTHNTLNIKNAVAG